MTSRERLIRILENCDNITSKLTVLQNLILNDTIMLKSGTTLEDLKALDIPGIIIEIAQSDRAVNNAKTILMNIERSRPLVVITDDFI
jgi:hypothetical protein